MPGVVSCRGGWRVSVQCGSGIFSKAVFFLNENKKKLKIYLEKLKLLVRMILMNEKLSRVEIYNEEYVDLNHAYVQMYKFYNRLLSATDADEEVLSVIREILLVFNPTLDRIKSEMTVKTRFKEENLSSKTEKVVNGGVSQVILHGNFTGE